jgi:hypothetical protein
MVPNVCEESMEKSVEMDHETTTEKVENVEKGKLEEEQVESENKMIVNENSPVVHYWKDEECQPLVHPSDATSLGILCN